MGGRHQVWERGWAREAQEKAVREAGIKGSAITAERKDTKRRSAVSRERRIVWRAWEDKGAKRVTWGRWKVWR